MLHDALPISCNKVQHKIRWIASQVGLIDQYSATVDEKILPSKKAPRRGMIHFKTFERFVGFLVYVAQTYTTFVPYLKGLYLTLNSWRPGLDEEGWHKPEYEGDKCSDGQDAPRWVEMVPRLALDIEALMKLSHFEDPPHIDQSVLCHC